MRPARWVSACVFLLALYPLGAAGQDKAAREDKFDPDKMTGTWTYVSGVKNGEKVDPDHFKDSKVTITKDTMTLEGPAGKFVLKYTLDTKKKPVTVSMKMIEGAGEGSTAEGIVQVKGDDLTICYAREGEGPTKFEAKEGSNHHLFVLKRSK
jgi:uncharacterized protein (TIGR03067 family)